MAAIALGITNAVLGLGSIGAGIGFSVAEKEKMDDLNAKADKLKKDAQDAGDLYDHTYYFVTQNLKRVKNAVEALPDDFLAKVDEAIQQAVGSSDTEQSIATLGKVLGYVGIAGASLSAIIRAVRVIRARRAASGEPEPTIADDAQNPFSDVPVDAEPTPQPETETLGTTKLSNRLLFGLDIANTVFALGGLAVTIGLGIWTLEKLDEAIQAVETKQKEVAKFQKSMTTVLDQVVTDAGLPPKSYDQLQKLAETWKTFSVHYEGYSKALKFAIQYFFLGKSYDEVKKKVTDPKVSDPGNPFPEDGYVLAKTLAEGIRSQFDQGKSDKEIVASYATDDPKHSIRFVLDEFFVATLRSLKDL